MISLLYSGYQRNEDPLHPSMSISRTSIFYSDVLVPAGKSAVAGHSFIPCLLMKHENYKFSGKAYTVNIKLIISTRLLFVQQKTEYPTNNC